MQHIRSGSVHRIPTTLGRGVFCGVVVTAIMASVLSPDTAAQDSQNATRQGPPSAAAAPMRLLAPLYISVDQIRATDIGGKVTLSGRPVVHGWVIADSADLEPPVRRMVFTNSQGKYVFRDLPLATYSLSIRGYDLGEAPPVKAQPGQVVPLVAVADAQREAAAWDAKWAAVTSTPLEIIVRHRDDVRPPGFEELHGDGTYVFGSLPAPSSPKEPIAPRASISRGVAFLDRVNAEWGRKQRCITCHTNFNYMIGRSMLGHHDSAEAREVRAFFEAQSRSSRSRLFWTSAVPLALNDAGAGNTLHPVTREALDTLMRLQRAEGGWAGYLGDNAPFEEGDYYPNAMAAVAIGHAPEGYAQTETGAAGLAKLEQYLKSADPVHLHNRAIVLWASVATPRLMSAKERAATIKELLDRQRPDGGWSFASLGNWRRHDGQLNDPRTSPSDGYGTGLVTFILCQTGMSAQSPALSRAVKWLETNQRVSGRWFTPTMNYDDGLNIITNTGTIYALMALKACG